ncbi:MAG: homoserine dehydrogenase [Clostridiales bacterium]|nr:homoserine dehydrogenase [Clostridiales bacterium]
MTKVAVLGYGVVGSGVVELFYKNKQHIEKKAGQEIDIKYILDIRDFPDSPYKDKFVKDSNVIINDDEIKVVAECMGGIEPAYSFVKACLEKGKSVTTSNKELVAEKGAELLDIAKKMDCNFFFEASVGGAIPIIRPLHRCLAANEIIEISGILNGTTNFILTKMIDEKMSFEDALNLAQELGYAEKDPTDDVEGNDACRKICILASLAFGKHVYPKNVYTKGIRGITLQDVEFAKAWGSSIKLIGSVKMLENEKIHISVEPKLVPYDNLISRVDDVFNAVMVVGDAIDKTMFYGRGAGKLPTASAVISDLIELVKHDRMVFSQYWEDSSDTSNIEEYCKAQSRMYFRVDKMNSDLFGDVEYISANETEEIAFITHIMNIKDAIKLKIKIEENGIKVKSMISVLDID